jgi:hypothetical protein
VREAAARVYGCEAESIHIELEERDDYRDKDGRYSIVINYNHSMKAAPDVRERVKVAVAAALPDKYKGYRVTIV